jgi:sugar/nucleoside kinase (ribokinase family)
MPTHPKRFDVSIVGDMNLDLVLDGLPETMPVERELIASAFRVTLGGSAAILAHNLAALGLEVGFSGLAAKDAFGKIARDWLSGQGVDISHLRDSGGQTGSGATVLLNHDGGRHILSYLGVTGELSLSHLDLDHICSARHFHLSSLFLLKGLQPALPALFQAIKQRGLSLSLDTNDDPQDRWHGILDELLPLIDILLPNERELLRMTGTDSLAAALDIMANKVPIIAVKRGAKGAMVQQAGRRWPVPPVTVAPVDTIGAGDSFNAGFLAGYVRGLPPVECAALGTVAGAISTLKTGGVEAFRDLVFLRNAIRDLDPASKLLAFLAPEPQ